MVDPSLVGHYHCFQFKNSNFTKYIWEINKFSLKTDRINVPLETSQLEFQAVGDHTCQLLKKFRDVSCRQYDNHVILPTGVVTELLTSKSLKMFL